MGVALMEERMSSLREKWEQASEEEHVEARGRREVAAQCRKVEQDLTGYEEEEALQRAEYLSKMARRGPLQRFGFCGGRVSLEETEEACSDLHHFTELARESQEEAMRQVGQAQMVREELDEMRSRYQVQAESGSLEAPEAASRMPHEASLRQEAPQAEASEQHEEAQARASLRAARREVMNTTIALVPDVPLAVRIPRYISTQDGMLSSTIYFTIIVEGPGSTETLEKQYSDFKSLHEVLSAKPFARTLQALPQDWLFTSFSSTMLERRRRHLEAYLSFLCTHAQVLQDDTIWRWLGVDDLTQVVVRLVVARTTEWPAETCRLVQTLEAVIAAGGDASRCVHPALLGVLREVLLDNGDEAAQAAACRLLSHILVGSARARQLFLPAGVAGGPSGGAEALLEVCQAAGEVAKRAAADTTKMVLNAFCAEDAVAGVAEERTQAVVAEHAEQREAEAEVREEQEPEQCCVCLDRGKSHAFLPCGHLCTCMDCADYLAARNQACPVCRRPIEQAVQIFL